MNEITIGVISDTHGLLRPEVLPALAGVDRIVHAGDVGKAEILTRLAGIAPVAAVRGNCDHGPWAEALPETEVVESAGVSLYVLHDLEELDLDPRAAGFHGVISGHTHRPVARTRQGVLYLNPGSAGPRRFNLPVTVALLHVRDGRLEPEIVPILGE
jgi:putative phosphoesterase